MPVLVVAACMGIPKAFLLPVQALLSSWERQDLIIRWGLVSGALNLVLDFALIPHHGAIGAALANGTAQTFSVVTLWVAAIRMLKVRISILPVAKIVLISAAMAIMVHLVTTHIPFLFAVVMAAILGPALYLILLRITFVLSPADRGRMLYLKHHVPSSVGRVFEASLNWMIPTPVSGD